MRPASRSISESAASAGANLTSYSSVTIKSGSAVAAAFSRSTFDFIAALPIALVGYFSAIHQAKVSCTGVSLIAKQTNEVGKAITSVALVEAYAIFALIVSLLMISFRKVCLMD
ncbi:MAG: hypothetical protein GX827_00435, partial [Clostridiales bacterium]|nr:hypothetical protein [Clostridiales bacterium]